MKKITLLDFEINRTKKTNRWLGLLSVCMMFLVGQLSFAQVQVGYDTTASYNAPFSNLWGYSYTQSIYTSAELSANAGTITAINYYYAGTTTLNTLNNFTLYIGHTTQSNFSSTTNWVPFADLTEVFSGGITATGAGWVTITLDTPFVYDGTSNLVIAFDENQASYTSSQTFRYSATGNAKTIQYRNDSTNPDPATPPTASVLHNFVANTQFVGLTSNLTAPSCLDTAPTFTAASAGCGNLGGTFSWTAPSTGFVSGYKVYIGTSAGNYDVVNGTVVTGLSYTMANSAINTTYYYSIVPTNPAGDAMACDEYSFTTASNICYCTPTTTGTYYLTNVTTTGGSTNISHTATAKAPGGYADLTATQIVTAWEGQEIGVSLSANTSTHYFFGWIDANGDGTFDNDTEKIIDTSTGYLLTWNGTLTIPNLPLGDYRIRVGSSWSGVIQPCGSANGEYKDFTLIVTAPPACLTPTALTATGITHNQAVLGWTSAGTSFDIELVEAGITPTGTPNYIGQANPFTTPATLTPLTSYEFYVRQNCGGTESTWTGPFSFTTECLPPSITGTTPGSVCGQGEIELSATADAGASIGWYAAQTGGTKLAEGATFTTPLITETTTFYVEAGNPIPNVIGQIGTTTTTSTSGGSSPYYHGWGGVKTQYIYKAEELIAAGLAAGEITSIAFDATTSGSALNNFTLHIGTTEATLATSTHIAGLDLVYSNASQAITVGLNTYTFTTPFVWDGSSNIVVQTSYSNNNTGGTSSSVRYHLPGSTLTTYTYADNKTAAQILATMTGNVDGSGNTTTSSNRANAYFNGTGICSSARTEVIATVTVAPALVLSETVDVICEGATSDAVTITTGAADYDTYVWNPATGVSGDATNGWTFNPTATTTYTLTASNSTTECATSVDFVVTVNAAPTVNGITASAVEICEGTSVDIAVNIPAPATYCLVSFPSSIEPITLVEISNINNVTSATLEGTPALEDFTAMVGNLVADTTYTITLNGNTGGGFTNNFYVYIDWNQNGVFTDAGETYSIGSIANNNGSGTPLIGSIAVPATALNGNTRMRVLKKFSASTNPGSCNTTGYGQAEDYTVNVTGGVDLDTYSWSDGTSVVGTASTLTVNPTATTTYTVTVTGSNGCVATDSVTITVNDVPVIDSIVASATEVCEGTEVTLEVPVNNNSTPLTYCNSYFDDADYEHITNVTFAGINNSSGGSAGGPVNYTSQVANVTVGTASTLSVTIEADEYEYVYAFIDWNQNGILDDAGETYILATSTFSSGPFTLSITPPATAFNGNTRMRVMVVYDDVPYPCYEGSFFGFGEAEDYTVNITGGISTDILTYSWSDGSTEVGTGATLTVTPTTTTTYTVTATNSSDCSVTESVVIMVNEAPQQPVIACYETATFNPAICDWEITGTQPAAPTDLACYETATFDDVTCAWVVTGEQPAAPTDLACYETATFNDTTCAWEVTGEQPEQPTTELACYESYVFNDTSCEWDVTGEQPEEPVLECYEIAEFNAVTCEWIVTGTAPATPTVDSPQTLSEGQTVADIIVTDVTGTLNWYDDNGTPISDSEVLSEGTYTFWVSQTIDGCESETIEVVVEVTLSTKGFDNASFRAYPNPVKDFFNVSYSKDITNVSVVNMLGQTVITQAVNSTATQIDMTGLPTGSYFVKVTADGAVKTVKVIKQ